MSHPGYGHLYPKDACSNWVSVIEAFVSMLLMSFMTGVAFVKFARPNPNIIFSKVRLPVAPLSGIHFICMLVKAEYFKTILIDMCCW